jgi:hypothetical protein
VIVVKAERLIKLADTSRTILRARYPQRPALADEIQNIRYFHSATINKKTGLRNDPEMQAADDALAVLRKAVVSQSIRLRGCLEKNLPNDIDPTEVEWNGIHVFDNTLEVYGERGQTLRTYWNVHCYEDEVRVILNTGRSKRVGAPPKADWDGAVKEHLFKLLDHHGAPDAADTDGWRSQADAERAVIAFIGENVASESIVRGHTSRLIGEWQTQKQKAGN